MQRNHWARVCWRTSVAAIGVAVLSGICGESPIVPAVSLAAEDLAKPAATVEEVAKVLDLRTLPLPQGAGEGRSQREGSRQISNQTRIDARNQDREKVGSKETKVR